MNELIIGADDDTLCAHDDPGPIDGWWIGARRLSRDGYVMLMTTAGWESEHRVVMERKLGRPLKRGESVHRRNGIRHDNEPGNLELWIGPIRSGIRARDFSCPHCGTPWEYPHPTISVGIDITMDATEEEVLEAFRVAQAELRGWATR